MKLIGLRALCEQKTVYNYIITFRMIIFQASKWKYCSLFFHRLASSLGFFGIWKKEINSQKPQILFSPFISAYVCVCIIFLSFMAKNFHKLLWNGFRTVESFEENFIFSRWENVV